MRHLRLPLAILALVAIAACGGGKSSSNAGSSGGSNAGSSAGSMGGSSGGSTGGGSMGSEGGAASANMPNCGAVQPVWVNLRTKKYHEEGDPAYGHTKHGEYLCPSAARQQGFVRAGGGSYRHHKHRSSGSMSGSNDQSDNGDNSDNSNP